MKKTYINPTINVVKIHTQQMLAVSAGSNTLDPSLTTDTYDSREFDFDDEDF